MIMKDGGKICDTCVYGHAYELDKPCIVYRDDCPLYQKVGDGMNREEAIKILENERDNHINSCKGVFYETRTEAIDMAIKALEQEPRGEMLICPECGLDVHSDFKTCPRCGDKMAESEG